MSENKKVSKSTEELIAETQAKLAKLQDRKRKEDQRRRESVGRAFLNVFENADLEHCEDYMKWVMELAKVQYDYRCNNPTYGDRKPTPYDDYDFKL